MSDYKRKTVLWSLSVLLFLFALVGSKAPAQTDSTEGKRWLECGVQWLIGEHYHEGSNFTVRVSFRGQPISGVKVVLTATQVDENGGYVAATGDTDPDGVAHFFAIPAGVYQAHVDKGLLAASELIEVSTNNTSTDEISTEWPRDPILTRNVRGWITSWQRSTPQNRSERRPLQHVLVQLLELRGAKLLASTYTSNEGYYEFPVAADGLYVIRVNEHKDPSLNGYDDAVEVTSGTIREHMPDLEVDEVCGGRLVELPDRTDGERAGVQ